MQTMFKRVLSFALALAEALRQLELVNVRIIGFVYRVNGRIGKSYGKYGKYGKYYAREDKSSGKKAAASPGT